MRALVAAIAILGSGCSLVVDTDAVRARSDAGPSAAVDAAPDADAAGLDASAADAAAPLDATTAHPDASAPSPCARDASTILACDPPVRLVNGADLSGPSIAGVTGGFMTALHERGAVVRRRVDRDGTITTSERYPVAARPDSVDVAGNGDAWAVAFTLPGARSFACRSSVATASTSRIDTTSDVTRVAVAVAPGGTVAIGGVEPDTFSTSLERAVATAPGCPATSRQYQPSYYTRGLSAAHLPGGAEGDFRFVVSSVHPNLEDSAIVAVAPSGNDFSYAVYNGLGLRRVSSAPTADGVFLASIYGHYDAASDTVSLTAMMHRADLGMAPDPERLLAPEVFDFALTGCGSGCLAAAYLASPDRGRLTVSFVSDDLGLMPLGVEPEHDVACGVSAQGGEIDVAYSEGRLAVLYTQGTRAELYLCDKPAL